MGGQEIFEWLSAMRLLLHLAGGPAIVAGDAEARLHEEKHSVQRPHIANVLDLLEDQNCYFVVMDHVQGRDLFDFFVQSRIYEKISTGLSSSSTSRASRALVKNVAKELITGVKELHQIGLIHKDLKLENLVLDEAFGEQR